MELDLETEIYGIYGCVLCAITENDCVYHLTSKCEIGLCHLYKKYSSLLVLFDNS